MKKQITSLTYKTKEEATRKICQSKSITTSGYGPDAYIALEELAENIKATNNKNILLITSENAIEAQVDSMFPGNYIKREEPNWLNSNKHSTFKSPNINEKITSFDLLYLNNGTLSLLYDAPIICDNNGSVIKDYSSRYTNLIYYIQYDFNESKTKPSMVIDGDVYVILDDIDRNYCHWIAERLTRLAAIENKNKTYIVTTPLTSRFQQESLAATGIAQDQVIELDNWQSLRARRLIVPSNLGNGVRHPAHRGSEWAMNYLRNIRKKYGLENNRDRKLWISRSKARGRMVINEDDFKKSLISLGFEYYNLEGMNFIDQIKLFSSAKVVCGMHGAGLTNIVFMHSRSKIIELLSPTYGMPTYWLLANGAHLDYYALVANNVLKGERSQLDSIRLEKSDLNALIDTAFD